MGLLSVSVITWKHSESCPALQFVEILVESVRMGKLDDNLGF